MPRKYQAGTWEGEPHYRWVKMYKGVRYRINCKELGANTWTKEGSYQLANEWWRKKLQEIEKPEQFAKFEKEYRRYEEWARSSGMSNLPPAAAQMLRELHQGDEKITEFPADAFGVYAEIRHDLAQAHEEAAERSIKACGQRFLSLVQGKMGHRSYEEISGYIESLNRMPILRQGRLKVEQIDENLVDEMFKALNEASLSEGRKKKHWGFFQRFLRFLWERRLVEMPRNLKSVKFTVSPQKIKEYPIEEVRQVLASLQPRLKLYALLGLNCAMINTDMAALKKDEVDFNKGTITRKRSKTSKKENVPEVCYKLWPETAELLRENESQDAKLFLTSRKGTSLLETRIQEGKAKRYDQIGQKWRLAKIKIPLKAFRSISATLLESHEVYGRCTSLFLGHSPRSIKDRHYAAPPQQLLDQAICWLRDQILI